MKINLIVDEALRSVSMKVIICSVILLIVGRQEKNMGLKVSAYVDCAIEVIPTLAYHQAIQVTHQTVLSKSTFGHSHLHMLRVSGLNGVICGCMIVATSPRYHMYMKVNIVTTGPRKLCTLRRVQLLKINELLFR